MNERIQELMDKTLDSEFSHTWDTMTYEGLLQFSEKFAELLVQECADVAVKFHLAHPYSVEYQIKKHFGVEE